MTNRQRLSRFGILSLLILSAPYAPLGAQNDVRTCQRGVAALLFEDDYYDPSPGHGERDRGRSESNPGFGPSGAEIEVRAATGTRSGSERDYGFADRSLSWRAPDASEGTCRVDSRGRVSTIEVTHFGSGVIVDSGSAAPGVGAPYSLTCESVGDRRRECTVPSRSRVRLQRQMSDARCVENSTWGLIGDRLWVDRGCRAAFSIEPGLGNAWGTGYSGSGYDDERLAAAARSGCENRAGGQSMQVLKIVDTRRLDTTRWEVGMEMDQRGRRFLATCRYDERSGYAEISSR